MAVNEEKLGELVGRAVVDMGAVTTGALVLIGDKLGLYRAMAQNGRTTPEALAASTGTDARYVREWLSNQAASGYVSYDPETREFWLDEEQEFAFAHADNPLYLPGGFQVQMAATKSLDTFYDRFRTGQGFGWHEHDADLFEGCERFFRPGYAAHLVDEWIPALDPEIVARLNKGAKVADVGCGHGSSTVLMAEAFPNSTFTGFDYHEASVQVATERAEAAGVADRVTFTIGRAQDFPGSDYDLVTMFDCLHDMGDPAGAAHHVRSTLAPGASWMIVEPFAGDHLEDNLNPVGRLFYGASALICTPASRDQEVGLCLGAQAGQARLEEVVRAGGFSGLRRATETPFNLVLEARV